MNSRTIVTIFLAALALAGCTNTSTTSVIPSATLARVAPHGLPVDRSTTWQLALTIDNTTQPTRNGSTVEVSGDFTKYKGASLTVLDGTKAPANFPKMPGSAKVLLYIAMSVNKIVYASGTGWLFNMSVPNCSSSTTAAFYYKGVWTQGHGAAPSCGALAVFPFWTILKPGLHYYVAVYNQ
jgi:hypothetical protein